jgi:trimeric autotransporter adhesin
MKLLLTSQSPGVFRRHLLQKLALACLLCFATLVQSNAQIVYALSGSTLFSFDASAPTTVLTTNTIVGVASGQTIEGIDFRPNTGQLYAIGYNQTSGETRLYTINLVTGAATAIGTAPVMLQPNMGEVNFDFNPTVDRIRVTGSNTANYRLHPVTGAIAATDGNLAYAAGDVNAAATPFIAAAAYSNSFIGTTTTTLYNYDAALNVLTTQVPPNSGTCNTVGMSGLLVDAFNPAVDMDIFFDAATQTNTAILVATTGVVPTTNFYTVNLASGVATALSPTSIPLIVDDIAIKIEQNVPTQITGQLIYAITANNSLISFDSDAPGIIRSIVSVTGVAMGQAIEGIDFRPNTGELYAIGYNQTTGEARLYTINLTTGAATAVGAAPVTLAAAMGEISFDFNPTVDRIRVMGSNDANYRLHPVTGAVVATDGTLAYAVGDVNAAANPVIAASAYTNSYIGTTTTTLYNYDAALNIITTQNPPNAGVLNTVGASGIIVNVADPLVDMDIFFDAASSANMAFVSAAQSGTTANAFYTLNLATGTATSVGLIGAGINVNDIAAFIDRTIPAQTGQVVYALTGNNNLISFDSDLPSIIRSITPTSGVFAGQPLMGLDFRPATGELYAIGYNNNSGMARLYTINTMTGAATAIGTDSVMLQSGMGGIVFDFNPTVDRIRVMGSNGSNFRMNPVTGAIAATDGSLAFAAGDANQNATPAVGAGAYTNSFNGTTTTTLYDYDYNLNVLASQIPPNNGTLNTIGSTGIVVNAAMPTIDMDVYYAYVDGSNTAYLNANTGTANNDGFYKINLMTGAASLVGPIGFGIPVRSIAVVLDTPPPPSTTFRAHLSGHGQPFPVATAGTGDITATLTGNTLVVTGNYGGLTGLIDLAIAGGAHIHAGYAGQSGGIEVGLVPTPDVAMTGGTFTALLNTFTLTQTQIDLLNNRQLYINIHTTAYAGGEIRGQLLPEVDGYFSANLFGSNQTPAVISNGTAALALELNGDSLVVSGSFDNLDGEFDPNIAGGAHLHLGLTGGAGGIEIELVATADADNYGGVFAPADNTFVLTASQIAALNAQQLYANIHTMSFPSGEIRGQVVGDADVVFRAHLSGANEYPFVTSLADGQVMAELRGNTLRVSGTFKGLESMATASHIHLGAAGTSGGVAFPLTYALDAGATSGVFQAEDNTFTLTNDQVASLLNRDFYVNIHTMGHAGGEVRGQLMLESQTFFTAFLTGSQQVPDVSSGAHGSVIAEVSGNRLTLSGSFAELGSPLNVAIAGGGHIHAGLPGLNGPVLFPLVADLDANLLGGSYSPALNTFMLNAGQRDTFLARGMYINLHTLDFAGGEIRGNLLGEASAYFLSPLSGASQTPAVNVPATGLMILEVTGHNGQAVGSFSNLGTDFDVNIAGGAHFHSAYAGSNGNIAAELEASFDVDFMNGIFSADINAFTMSDGFLDSLRARQIYTNIHTSGVPGGEVRGQLMPLAGSYFHTSLMGINSASPVISNGAGGLKLELNGDMLTATGSFSSLDGQFDPAVAGGSHIHIGEPGNGGGIVFELDATLDAGNQGGFFAADGNSFSLTAAQAASLRNGEFYVNIHTTTEAGGEIRGQILPEINFFPTSSDLNLPLPGASINVAGLPTDLLNLAWTPATDPDGDNVVYVWQVATDVDFNNVVFMLGAGDNLLTSVTYGELDAVLAANGVNVGASVTLYHRIAVTDGSNATPGEANDAQFIRGVVSGTGEVLADMFGVSISPTITSGQPVNIQINATQSAEVEMMLVNSNGQVMEARSLNVGAGSQDYRLNMDYAPGAYFVSLKTAQGTLPTQRILVIK